MRRRAAQTTFSMRGHGAARIALAAVLAVGFAGSVQVAAGATGHKSKHTVKCSKTHAAKRRRHEKAKPCKRSKRAAAKPHAPAITPTATTPTTTTPVASTPTPAPPTTPTPTCPKREPLPAPMPGQTTIAGYTRVEGGAASVYSCLPRVGNETVLLTNLAGETLQTQTPGEGQPFNFVVEPGEYYVMASCEHEAAKEQKVTFVAHAGQQNQDELYCSIP
jgi:hypothetical protein